MTERESHGYDVPRRAPLDLGIPIRFFRCPPREIGEEAEAITAAAVMAASGTFPGAGGLHEQPALLVEAMAVIGAVYGEAERLERKNGEHGNRD